MYLVLLSENSACALAKRVAFSSVLYAEICFCVHVVGIYVCLYANVRTYILRESKIYIYI